MPKLMISVLLLFCAAASLSAALPVGSWIYRSNDSWKYAEVLTSYEGDGASRVLREVGSDGYITQLFQKGEFHREGEQLVFTAPKSFIFFEGSEGFGQMVEDIPVRIVLGALEHDGAEELSFGDRTYRSSLRMIDEIISDEQRILKDAVPFLNLTVFSMQSQIKGFGTEDMLTYWKSPARIPGGTGGVDVSMESSGTVMFFFPKLPVRLHMVFDSYSIIHGITISGSQTTFSRNRRGDGYLYGDLIVHGICRLTYGEADGTNAIAIADGTIDGGYLQMKINNQVYWIPAELQ